MMTTDCQAKYFAYDLTRRIAPDSPERMAGAVAGAQVDLNPHQVDAALFAFASPLSKGALLADEVGLGKTIEAGLVISQRWAERKRRILTNAVKDHSAELVSGSVAPSSVLVMAVVPGRVPALARVGSRSDPLKTWLDKEAKGTTVEWPAVRYSAPRRRAKNRPTLERARGAIEELYPDGVPSQSAEPNVNLCRRVGEKLKKSGLPNVSNDTILRAAGRRK
jgi:hypothetical protein